MWSRVATGSITVVRSVASPASSTHDFTCALATGSSYSIPLSGAPWTVNGGKRPSRASIRAPIRAQRLGDPVDRPAADRLVAVEREARPCWKASQPGSSRISVPALPTSIGADRRAGVAQPAAADQDLVGARARRSRRARAPRASVERVSAASR